MRIFPLLLTLLAASSLAACRASAPAPGQARNGALAVRSASGPQAYQLQARGAAVARLAEEGVDLLQVKPETGKVLALLRPEQAASLAKRGFHPTPARVGHDRLIEELDPAYHSNAESLAAMKAIVAKHPKLASLHDVGDSWEKQHRKGGHDIWALRLGTAAPGTKPAAFFCGNMHAREVATTELCLKLAETLAEGHASDPAMARLLAEREVWILPIANPDGHARAEQGLDWRKNADADFGSGDEFDLPFGIGVDLNRNFGFQWGGEGASKKAEHPTFRGPAAFSEPESQAVRDLMRAKKFKVAMFYHSFSALVLYPWGYSTEAPPEAARFQSIARKLGELSGYEAKQASSLYPASGNTDDWAFSELGTFSFTTEMGTQDDGFSPEAPVLQRYWKENGEGALHLIRIAADPR